MSSDVTANSRTVVHKGDGIVNVSALPDVCKTPSPGGPVPVPYPNVAQSSDLADGAKHVTIEGNPVALENSKLKQSSGDEAGTLGGVVSGKNRGKMTWGTSSPDVCVEGKGVIRFADLTHHNCNSYNTIHVNGGKPYIIVVYGDDEPCPICEEEAPPHASLANRTDTDTSVIQMVDSIIAGLGSANVARKFMVGVAKCQDCGGYIAAKSSNPEDDLYPLLNRTNPGADPSIRFIYVAKAQTPSCDTEDEWHARYAKSRAKKVTSRMVIVRTIGVNVRRACGASLRDARRRAVIAAIDGRRNVSNALGNCAGPRVLALALALGHRPDMLCERLYQGNQNKNGPVKVDPLERAFSGYSSFLARQSPLPRPPRYRSFKHGEDVPSCETCKIQIPALLCQVEARKTCPRKRQPPSHQ